ncbi:hypothetical protein AYM02_09645 [Coxiella burnetii]|uniref:Uncharacterized protein n=2 Tax=Coxiella burnetii TaxID=777 RepID=Q83E14_COXBU|nr:hypothetical protein [Coxiella burnetii]NP_819554.1 hypothetical protein CBU_0522 [Coxiella burnetii RSA 493]ABS78193.1 hypothetical protein CBUD_1540 [Coxiella burnetii Dugway 5J108-111]ABX78732.1 hypothetical protein COXBURSA331_A0635 [Coxiella burnetii RSA 331]ACJ20495.1 hypothetical protein CbuK_1315 [Coxiella burnetii CbuK_Q154]AIT63568.1 hypothetical protein CBNA_1317 [Coxiella burnetii str. Namibia]ATN86129.1 hypothetical protein AYO29_06580 [Coxiella burnetii str. Schperling]EDQ95
MRHCKKRNRDEAVTGGYVHPIPEKNNRLLNFGEIALVVTQGDFTKVQIRFKKTKEN